MAQVTTHLMREIGTDQMVLINPLQIRFIRTPPVRAAVEGIALCAEA